MPTPMGTGIEGALRMMGTTTGRGIQRALSDNGNANRYGNSKSAYRRELRERVQEFKERLETTSKATGTGIQAALTDDSNWKKNPRTGMSRSNS
jgi:signal transduction histidine kinase